MKVLPTFRLGALVSYVCTEEGCSTYVGERNVGELATNGVDSHLLPVRVRCKTWNAEWNATMERNSECNDE